MTFSEFFNKIVGWIAAFGMRLLSAGLLLAVGHFLIKRTVKCIVRGRFAQKQDQTVVTVLTHFVTAALYLVLTVAVVGILGVPTASFIAAIASAGVAVGLALQGALGNIAGGIMILILRPFRVGDFVELAGFSGTVTDIGIFYTVLTAADNKVITVPNGSVIGDSITNFSRKKTRRAELKFHVAYGSDTQKVKRILLEEAERQERVLREPAPFARLFEHGESALVFTLRVWCAGADYWSVYFDMLEAVHERLAREGIEIPFRQVDVHIAKQ